RMSTIIRWHAIGLDLATVISRCRESILSRHLVRHSRQVSKTMPGQPIILDTLTKAVSDARDRATVGPGITVDTPPALHEMRTLAARLHAAGGRDAQALRGHKSRKMTNLYRNSRGAE